VTMFTLPNLDESVCDPATVHTGETSGFGALRTSAGNLPLKQLHYRTRIIGLAIHTTIAQTYYNPFDECIEATYIFPIEGEQAVTDCEMWIGRRVVRALLKERGQARADYRRAIARGHRAALLEENRPETFSMKVGNIAPGEAVQVRIETVGHLPVIAGEWTLRIPLVVAPRYTSGFALPHIFAGNSAGDGVASDTDQVPDASAVTPPTWLPGFASPVDLKLEVNMTPGSLATRADWPTLIRSSLHAVSTELKGDGETKSCTISVLPGERINRDFILRGSYAESSISAAIVVEPPPPSPHLNSTDDRSTLAIQIVPPKVDSQVSRDVVFLLDRSGSMGGWKMEAARRGISRLIDSLSPNDRFGVLVFDDQFESPSLENLDHYPRMGVTTRYDAVHLTTATDANRYKAFRWLANIDTRGGTEMGLAIKHALDAFGALPRSGDEAPKRARAIVLVTDGQITGEDSLIRLLGNVPNAHRPQIFCLGVDRAVNGSVLQRLTKMTGGTYELVESPNRLDEVLKRFASEVGSPALSELEVIAENSHDDLQWVPGNVKTLYAGRAMSFYGRAKAGGPLAITVRGRLASGQLWQTSLEIPNSPESQSCVPMLLPMWARGRIRELEDLAISQPSVASSLKNQIIDCSLRSRVLSRFTAFVAVDETEQVNVNGQLHKVMQPVEYPDGWQDISMATIDRSHLIPIPGKQPTVVPKAPEKTNPPQTVQHLSRTGLSTLPPSFESLMVGPGIVSVEQWSDAVGFASRSGKSVSDALVEMQYATPEQVAKVTADAYRLPFMDLRLATIEEMVIDLVPESVARENSIVPISQSQQSLTIAISDPADRDTIEKLRFILNRDILTVVASHEAIVETINQRYGQVVGESADSMLQEFTDTAIDFTETTHDWDRDDEYLHDYISDDVSTNFLSSARAAQACMTPDFGSPQNTSSPLKRLGEVFSKLVGKPAPAPVVKLVQLIFEEAVALRATHIVVQSESDGLSVVYVIAGLEVPRDRVPRQLTAALVTRLKMMCNLDITASKPLESGRCSIAVNGNHKTCEVHFRETTEGVSILIDVVPMLIDNAPDAVKDWWAAGA